MFMGTQGDSKPPGVCDRIGSKPRHEVEATRGSGLKIEDTKSEIGRRVLLGVNGRSPPHGGLRCLWGPRGTRSPLVFATE